MIKRSLAVGAVVAALLLGFIATPQAQNNAQIQAALQVFLQQAHTWTQTQTFSSIVVTGACTGCGGGGGTSFGAITTGTNTAATMTVGTGGSIVASGSGSITATTMAATGLTGNLAVARFNSGTGASASTFWRGDGTWATPAGGGGTPASPDTSVQFNSGGSFGGSDNLTWVEPVLAVGLDGASSAAATFWAGFPQIFLQEMSGTLTPGFISYVYNSTASLAGGFYPMRSRGTPGSPTAVQSGDNLGVFEPEGYDGSDWATPASFQFLTTEGFSGSAHGTKAVLKLTSNGGSIQDKTYDFGTGTFTVPANINAAGDITIGGSVLPTGYKSADGTAGVTVTTCTSFKNGLCVAGT